MSLYETKLNGNFVKFHKILKILHFLLSHSFQFFGNILDSFKFWKFTTHNTEAMAKDQKVNITVT